ncbi:phosphate acetyltransferase [Candidatus Woesearchaeota archaeon]|nr:phosphate acetyltransferase [Candidatus Woesearchaeota archaeon]
MDLFSGLLGKKGFREQLVSEAAGIHGKFPKKIVFADTDDFVLSAASLVKRRRIASPIILGDSDKLRASFRRLGLANLETEDILDYLFAENSEILEGYAKDYLAMRKARGKLLSDKEAIERMSRSSFYAAMMVRKGLADGMISGASAATKPYQPAMEIIGLVKGVSKMSGAFFMSKDSGEAYLFSDCGINMSPNSEHLAEAAWLSARTASAAGLIPKVAMLSFSTNGSSRHLSVERVKLATAMLKRKDSSILVDGDIQVDAAINPEVMKRKCPDSPLKGSANVLIFPDLNSANISYKLLERLGGYYALGPLLLGLEKPANDIALGSSAQAVFYLCAATVIQAANPLKPEEVGFRDVEKGEARVNEDAQRKKAASDPLDLLPSNVRKIIEEGRKSAAKDEDSDVSKGA